MKKKKNFFVLAFKENKTTSWKENLPYELRNRDHKNNNNKKQREWEVLGVRELAMEISLTSLGSSQTFPLPHLRTLAASRFCSFRDTIFAPLCFSAVVAAADTSFVEGTSANPSFFLLWIGYAQRGPWALQSHLNWAGPHSGPTTPHHGISGFASQHVWTGPYLQKSMKKNVKRLFKEIIADKIMMIRLRQTLAIFS